MIEFVVGLVEEHVGSGVSRFPESILERWHSAIASQQTVVVWNFEVHACLHAFSHELSHCRCWAFWFHDIFQGRLVLQRCVSQVALICLKNRVLRQKNSPLISLERDVFLFRPTISSFVISGCPDIYHNLDLELVGRILPCRATFPSGCWTTFEPNSLVQSWRSEISGGGRGDMNAFSWKSSQVFNLTNFLHTISWKCFLKDDSIRSSVIEFQSFLNSKIDVDPNKLCLDVFFSALCRYCAVRGSFLRSSITSGSLWLLSIRSTSKKNIVCLLLESWPPGINPQLRMECKLIEHPTWYMNWKKLPCIKTLFCNEGSTRLRPECPWKSSEIHNCSWRTSPVVESFVISSSSPPSMLSHLLSDQWGECRKCFLGFFVILQKCTAPYSSRCTCSEWQRRYFTFFDTLIIGANSFFQWDRFSVKSQHVLYSCFCFCLWSACKISRIQF